MRGIVRGLSFGFLIAAAAFGGAVIEHGLLTRPIGTARFLNQLPHSLVPMRLPLRGSQDIGAPLLLPSEAPEAPRRPPARKHWSPAVQFAEVPLLDTKVRAG